MKVISRKLSQRVPFRSPVPSTKGSTQTTSQTQVKKKTFHHNSVSEEDEPVLQIETIETNESYSEGEDESDWENYDIDVSPSRFTEVGDIQDAAAEATTTIDDEDQQTNLPKKDDSMWTGSFQCTDFLADYVFAGACSMHSIGGKRLTKTRPKAVSLQSFLAKVFRQDPDIDQETFSSVNCTSLNLSNYFKNKENAKSKYYKAAVVRVTQKLQDKSTRSKQRFAQTGLPDSVIRKLERLAALRKRRDSVPKAAKFDRSNRSLPSKKALEIFRQQKRTQSMTILHDFSKNKECTTVNDSPPMEDLKQYTDHNRKQLLPIDASHSNLLTEHSSLEFVESESSRQSGSSPNSSCLSRTSTSKEKVVGNDEIEGDEHHITVSDKIMNKEGEELVQSKEQTHSTSISSSGFLATVFDIINVSALWKELIRISMKK
jgi:hypothetical protein